MLDAVAETHVANTGGAVTAQQSMAIGFVWLMSSASGTIPPCRGRWLPAEGYGIGRRRRRPAQRVADRLINAVFQWISRSKAVALAPPTRKVVIT